MECFLSTLSIRNSGLTLNGFTVFFIIDLMLLKYFYLCWYLVTCASEIVARKRRSSFSMSSLWERLRGTESLVQARSHTEVVQNLGRAEQHRAQLGHDRIPSSLDCC